MAKRFTFTDAKAKIAELETQLKAEIKDKKIAIDMFESQGNKDTVTFFQLIGWSTAAFILGGLLVWIF